MLDMLTPMVDYAASYAMTLHDTDQYYAICRQPRYVARQAYGIQESRMRAGERSAERAL